MTTASAASSIRLGGLHRGHRARIEEILAATDSFSVEEIGVALELFDESSRPAAHVPFDPGAGIASYEFIGAFTRDGELIGYACYGATPGTDRTYDLYWIAVHPAHQGTGGGSRLLDEVERRLSEREARLLVVETSSRVSYAATRNFYARRGYCEHGRLADFYAPGDDRVICSKRLTQ